ncbi:MAG: response regulator [Verrucomicrobiota bacterium]
MTDAQMIVVAEDEVDAARLLDFHLRRSGYQPVLAEDGLAALNESFTRKPALILLDLMMPKLDGFQVCRMLKSSPITRHIPVMLLTAMATPEDKLRGFGHGADDYVTKPYAMPELLARINTLLTRPQSHGHHDIATPHSDR